MTPEKLWQMFQKEHGVFNATYTAFSFGADESQADALAELVYNGIKTATCSLYLWYEKEDEPLPEVGTYSVILDGRSQAICIVKNTRVYLVPFNEVTPEHAFKEGEGDRTLAYWHAVHEQFFTRELADSNRLFDENMLLVCEEFEVVYRLDDVNRKAIT